MFRHSEIRLDSTVCANKRQQATWVFGLLCGSLLAAAGCEGHGSFGAAQARSADTEIAGQSSLPLVPSETKLNLGQVPPGGQKSCDFWLTNRTTEPVEVIQIATSCDCLKAEVPNRVVSPGQKVTGRIVLDLRKDPLFTGSLHISVVGRDK